MNCVLSGNSGLAFVMDGTHAFVVRADRPEVLEDVHVQQFHNLFAGSSDRIFLEGVALGQIKEELLFAQAASTALSLVLLVLDNDAPEDLRAEAAHDLQEFFSESRTVTDVENVLSAAPFPKTADAVTAERLCRQAGTDAAADLLAELVARQDHVRAVCEAWDALPAELFESADNRRAARAVCVREGLFLMLVRCKEADRGANSFLLDSLSKPTMLRSFVDFRKVLQRWSGVLTETVHVEGLRSVRSIEMAESDDEYDLIPLRDESPERLKTPVSRNPGAKLLVDEAIRQFIGLLPVACKTGTAAVTKLVTETRQRLEEIHTRRADERSHFIKSISYVAEQLMQHNQTAAAVELLSWSLKNGLADVFTYNGLVDAWGKLGNAARAQEVFDAAQAAGVTNKFTYNALVDAWGKSGDAVRAQEIFDAALAAGMANEVTYNSLVDAWGKSGNALRAQEVFDASLAAGLANEITYNALVNAWGKSGNAVRAQEIFDSALAAGVANEITYNALVDAWGKSGNALRAQEVFEEALASRMADKVTYATLVDAWGKSGNALRAQEVFDAAVAAGMADVVTYAALLDAWGKSGNAVRAQEVFDAAVVAGKANEITYNALLDTWGKSGNPVRAQMVFDAAFAAGKANEVTYAALVDAWGKSGNAVRAQEVLDDAVAVQAANTFTYTALIDAWGRAGEPTRAQLIFDLAVNAGHADEVTGVVLLRALLSNSASEEMLTRAVEFFLSPRRDRISTSVATTIAWSAARLRRFDWIQSLPESARDARTLYSFAMRVAPSRDALLFLQGFGSPASAAIVTLRFRLLDMTGSAALRSLANDCRILLARTIDLDSFSRVRITEIEARCLRRCGTIEEAIAIWTPIDDLSIGNRETRASLLAESGRDLLIGGLRHHEAGRCKAGAQRLMQGWSVARLSDLHSMETLWAASEALSGYADARVEIATAPPGLVSIVLPILAEGARDGRWAMDAVRTSDFPEFYLKPALAGMEFLAELKRTSSSSINA